MGFRFVHLVAARIAEQFVRTPEDDPYMEVVDPEDRPKKTSLHRILVVPVVSVEQ